jgi:hypothetical protein
MSSAFSQKLTSQLFELMHLSKKFAKNRQSICTAKEYLTEEICQRKFGGVKEALVNLSRQPPVKYWIHDTLLGYKYGLQRSDRVSLLVFPQTSCLWSAGRGHRTPRLN